MLDANTEILRLRQSLRLKNISENVIDSICDEAAEQISNLTADALADAMSEAVLTGQNSSDFIEEVRASRLGSSFGVSTASGRSDFSEPPFPMLPKLLKNAKVAKDGSLYKVVPIKKSTGSTTNNSTISALSSIENARMAAKETRANSDSIHSTSISPDAMKGMATIAAMQSISSIRNKAKSESKGPVVAFRTASSKQDQNTQWINPGKKADMSEVLNYINHNLQDSIDNIIKEVIRRYGGMY